MHTFLSSHLALPYTLSLASIGRLYLHREIRQIYMQGRWCLELGGWVVWSKRGRQKIMMGLFHYTHSFRTNYTFPVFSSIGLFDV
jgi:hypothetical protein